MAGLTSSLGDWALTIALPFRVYERMGSVVATELMLAARSGPATLLGSVAGVPLDRWNHKRTMITVDRSPADYAGKWLAS